MLKELVDKQEHLELMVRHEVLLRDSVGNTAKANANGTVIATKEIRARSISLINVCLRYLSDVSNFDRKTK